MAWPNVPRARRTTNVDARTTHTQNSKTSFANATRATSQTRIDVSMERRTSVLHRRRGGRERRSQRVMETFAEDEDVTPDPTASSLSAAGAPNEPSGSRVWSSSCGGYRMRLPTPAVETTTVASSLNIDLKLPRIPDAKLSPRPQPEEACSRSAFVIEANTRLQSKLDLLNTQTDSPRAETVRSRAEEPVGRTSILMAVNRLGLAGMLGTNEEHAIEFKKGLGEVTGLMSARCAPPEAGGSGLWDTPTTQAVQPPSQKPVGKSPRQRAEERKEEMKRQLEEYRASKSRIQMEIEDRIERVRNDERFALEFENSVAKILQDRLIAQNNRYGEKDHVQLNVDGVWEMHSPRGVEERQQLRMEQQKERRAAARERFHAMTDRDEKAQVGDRRQMLAARRVETEARNRQMLLQSQWFMLLALAARASALGRVIEPERTRRKEYVAVLRIQLRIKLYVMRKREKMIVRRSLPPDQPSSTR